MSCTRIFNSGFRLVLPRLLKVSFALPMLACAALSSPLSASEVCMPAQEFDAALFDWYGETPQENSSQNLVLWASAETGTWTLVSYENGIACRIDHGNGWDKKLLLQVSDNN